MKSIEEKYARLLTSYCLELKEGDKFYLKSTTLAEPLVREVYKCAIEAGAIVEVDLDFAEKNNIFLHTAKEHQLRYVSPLYYNAMDKFDAYLLIRAPFNLKEDASVPAEATKIRSEALAAANGRYFTRIADSLTQTKPLSISDSGIGPGSGHVSYRIQRFCLPCLQTTSRQSGRRLAESKSRAAAYSRSSQQMPTCTLQRPGHRHPLLNQRPYLD
ncbi:hypothetical protein MASR1M65_20240 [Saprospiraceae bacterium]